MGVKKVFAVPDLHFPWHNAKALGQVYDAIAREKPDVVIQLGDLLDQYSFSKYARSFNELTPREEVQEGRLCAEAFWKNVKKSAHSKCRLIQLKGNHDVRIIKRVYEKAPELEDLVEVLQIYRFPDVETANSDRSEIRIDDAIYIHGWLSGVGRYVNYFNESVIHGHDHKLYTHFVPRKGRILFEASAGHLADMDAKPLKYTATESTNSTMGYLVKDAHGPRCCPLI